MGNHTSRSKSVGTSVTQHNNHWDREKPATLLLSSSVLFSLLLDAWRAHLDHFYMLPEHSPLVKMPDCVAVRVHVELFVIADPKIHVCISICGSGSMGS
jgi:hypothetical protein